MTCGECPIRIWEEGHHHPGRPACPMMIDEWNIYEDKVGSYVIMRDEEECDIDIMKPLWAELEALRKMAGGDPHERFEGIFGRTS